MTIFDNVGNDDDLWQFLQDKTMTATKTMTKKIQGTCDIWDTDYNCDNWEPGESLLSDNREGTDRPTITQN